MEAVINIQVYPEFGAVTVYFNSRMIPKKRQGRCSFNRATVYLNIWRIFYAEFF